MLAHAALADLRVATVHNGAVHRKDTVSGMTFSPAELLSFHSHVMPFYPGDILSTGTPGAVAIEPGDVVRCELGDEFASLTNPVSVGAEQSGSAASLHSSGILGSGRIMIAPGLQAPEWQSGGHKEALRRGICLAGSRNRHGR